MPRRLLFVLLGLGAAAVAAVLWSGAAYASTPHGFAPLPIQVPARPSAPAFPAPTLLAPTVPSPHVPPVAKPALPAAPVAVPPVVQHVLAVVPPVVDHTVRTVQTIVPGALPVVARPAAPRVPALAHHTQESLTAPAHQRADRVRPFATRAHSPSPAAALASSSARNRATLPTGTRHHAPLGDLADGANRAPQTANGMPFAVTRASVVPAAAGCNRLGLLRARVPAAVPLRDVARPG